METGWLTLLTEDDILIFVLTTLNVKLYKRVMYMCISRGK